MAENPAKVKYLALNVLAPGRFYLIQQRSGGQVGYATFDDPTGGGDKNDQGAVRTLLAFSDQKKAEDYITDELKNIGEIVEFSTSKKDCARVLRLMLSGKIYWFTFDRKPGSALFEDRYTCWQIYIKTFAEVVGCYNDAVRDQVNKKILWTPEDSTVKEIPDHIQKMIRDS